MAALPFGPFLPKFGDRRTRTIYTKGLELALWTFSGFALQTTGLQFTSANRSGFLLYLNVKLVPLAAWLLHGRRVTARAWLSAAMALVGTTTLLLGTGTTIASTQYLSSGSGPNWGDALSIAAAAASAIFIVRLERAVQNPQVNPQALSAVIAAGTAGLCLAWDAAAGYASDAGALVEGLAQISGWEWAIVGYLGLVTTALCTWIQAIGQQFISAERAAVIYAMDPVYGIGFAYLLLGEHFGWTGWIGAAFITAAAFVSTGAGASMSQREKHSSTAVGDGSGRNGCSGNGSGTTGSRDVEEDG